MAEVAIYLPDLHPGQIEVSRQAQRFNVICAGRRWGKNVLGLNQAAQTLLAGQRLGYFSPTYKTLSEDWRIYKDAFQPILKDKSEQEHRIVLKTGGVLEMWSLEEPDNALGRFYHRAIVDEAATVPGLEYAWNKVISYELSDYRGDAWFLSTPRGMNYFWQLWLRGQDRKRHPEWMSWRRPTSENPHIPPDEIERARREQVDAIFREESLAEFVEGTSGVFRNVTEAFGADRQELGIREHSYVIGVDWGKRTDYSVFSVIDASLKHQVRLERMQQVDYQLQVGRVEALARRFNPDIIVVEENAMGIPLVEQLQRLDLPIRPFKTTNTSKKELIERLSLAFEKSELTILDDPVQAAELQAFQATKTPTGMEKYSAPEGMHDDTVIALALAWSAAVAYPTLTTTPQGWRDVLRTRELGEPKDEPLSIGGGYFSER